MDATQHSSVVAVAGATGFVGRHLLPVLRDAGHTVRALARNPAAVRQQGVAVCRVDLDAADQRPLADALAGVDVAYYLVHGMGAGRDFGERDRLSAERFATACRDAGVSRIVYLGGLGADTADSPHLRSRRQVGDVLRASGVPVTELRAAVILGAGGSSFEIMRQLVEHLPVMVTPRWVSTRTQPIALGDVVAYLAGVCDAPAAEGRTLDIGGPDVLTFAEMMERYAAHQGLVHFDVPLPLLTPALSARWIGLVTDVAPDLARPLVQSLTTETVCRDNAIRDVVPRTPLPFDAAVDAALTLARAQGLRTRIGPDARFAAQASLGILLDYLSLRTTDRDGATGPWLGLAILYGLGAYGIVRTRPDVRPEAVAVGVATGAATAAASVAVTAVGVRWNRFPRLVERALRHDRQPRPLPALALAAAGFGEEMYWRGVVTNDHTAKRAFAAWVLPIAAARDPALLLAALTLGPVWTLLARRRGPAAAAIAHAVWLPLARSGVRRLLVSHPSTTPSRISRVRSV